MPSPYQFLRKFALWLGATAFLLFACLAPAVATISTTTSSVTAQGNNSTTAFSYNFIITQASYAVVQIINTNVTPNTITTLGPTQYTITGINNPSGGTVIYPLSGSPLAPGYYFVISRVVPLVQTTSIASQGPTFRAIENALDYLTEITQQLQAQILVLQAEAASGGTLPVPSGGRFITSGVSDTASTTDVNIIWASASTGAKTETLYQCTSSTAWKVLYVTDQSGTFGTYNLTLTAFSGDTVDLAPTSLMATNKQSSSLTCNGTGNWLMQ